MKSVKNLGQLIELSWAYRASRVLHVAVNMGLFEILSSNPLTAGEVAKELGSKPKMTEKMLIALTALGLIEFRKNKYKNSEIAEKYLVKGSYYQGNWIKHSYHLWDYWGDLEYEVGGTAASKKTAGREDRHYTFIMAMHDLAIGEEAEELLDFVDLQGRKRLLDVGGGPGTFSVLICQKYPEIRATVFDLPETIRITREMVTNYGMEERITFIEGDWNTDDFGEGYDTVLMSNILHGPESNAEMKLRKGYASLVDGGLLIVRDFVLNKSKTGPISQALFNIMVGAYSIDEIKNIIKDAGFVEVKEVEIPHKTHSIIVAYKEKRSYRE